MLASGLPPWTYALHLLVYPVWPLRIVRAYLTLAGLLSLALVGWLAWASSRAWPPLPRALLLASTVALGAVNATFTQGQNGLFVNAGLAALLWGLGCPGRLRDSVAGIGWALAMAKPTSALPFILIALVAGRWRIVLAGVAILAAVTAAVAARTHTPVIVLFEQFSRASLDVVGQGANIIQRSLVVAGANAALVRNVGVVAGGVLGVILAIRHRAAPVLLQAGLLAIVARLWSYHRAYDDLLLVFAVIAVAHVSRTRRQPVPWALLAATLALPYSLYVSEPALWAQAGVWIGVGIWLDRALAAARA